MNTKIKTRLLSLLLCCVMLIGLLPTSVFAAGTKLETPQNLKLQGTVLSWDAVDNADFYGITLYHPNYVYSIGSWQTDGTSINLYKYLKDGETYGATVIACSNGSYQISTPAEIPLKACTNAGVPIYRDVNVVNGTSSASTAYPGMSVRLEAKPAPDGMVFDRWELSGGYINIGYSDTETVIYVQAICDNDISARATYKYQENVTSAFTVQPQGGAALVGESFDVTYAMNFTPQGTVKVQVEGNTPGVFTNLKQGEIDSASIKEDSVVTKTFRIMASDSTRNIYSDEFVVSWEDGPRFTSQPVSGVVDHNVDYVVAYALNFTPFNCRVERYIEQYGQWMDLYAATATGATVSAYDFNTTSTYRIKAIIEGGGTVYSDEFTVTWSDAVSKFIQQPVGGTVGFDEDFTFTFAINFTPASNVAIQKYNSGFDSWDTVGYCTSLTSGTISGYASETTNKYRLEAYENGTPIHSNEFTVTWEGTDYTVSFAANGGTGTMASATGVSGDYVLPVCGFTAPANMQFKAWSVNGYQYKPGNIVSIAEDTTVTAVWNVKPTPTPEVEDGVTRIKGKSRYGTSFAIAGQTKEAMNVDKFENIIIASGKNFADALAGSYLAKVKNAPIIMASGTNDADIVDYVAENLAAGGTVYILGGTAAVPANTEAALDAYNVKRLKGSNRYGTNIEILKEAGVSNEEIIVATGLSFADSLSASAVGKPILLVDGKKGELTQVQKDYLNSLGTDKFYIVGGEGAVSTAYETLLAQYGSVERIKGKTRYETSVVIANTFFENPDFAVIAYGENFPDGLCGGPLAMAMDAPLILASASKQTDAKAYVESNGIKAGAVLGGTGVLSDEVAMTLFGATRIGVVHVDK